MDYEICVDKAKSSLLKMNIYFAEQEISDRASVLLPSSIEVGSETHFRYLFYSCLLNYGMKSSVLHRNLVILYEGMPALFMPQYICEKYWNDCTPLAEILRTHIHVRYPNQCAKNWWALSNTLHTQYHDNPQELFWGRYTYHHMQSAILAVKGFGQKTGGLLLRILIDNELLSPIDGIAEIPIDRHDIDLCIWLGIISNVTAEEIKRSSKIIAQLSQTWVNAANDMSISPSLADQYLWLIGSQFCAQEKCQVCPLYEMCERKR